MPVKPSGSSLPPSQQDDQRDDDRQDRPARAPDEDEWMLLVAVEDPLPRRQQPIGVAHVARASLSGPRVGPAVDVPDPLPGQMRVQLRRGDTRMPEQLLDDAQVGPTFEQMRRERVAQRVRADPLGEAGPRRRALDRGPGLLARQAPPAVAEEERPAARRRARDRARGASTRGPVIQRPSQSSATSPTGTSRSLSPLPMTRTNAPSTDRSSRSSPIASLIRSPAAYSSSRSARSRSASGCRRSGSVGRVGSPPAASQQALGLVDGEGLRQQPLRPRQVEMGGHVHADRAPRRRRTGRSP